VPELDVLVESAAEEPAVFGARLTGAGFGGCAAILLRRGEEREALTRIAARLAERFGRAPAIEVFGGDPGPREFPGPGPLKQTVDFSPTTLPIGPIDKPPSSR
jgi:galactokinase